MQLERRKQVELGLPFEVQGVDWEEVLRRTGDEDISDSEAEARAAAARLPELEAMVGGTASNVETGDTEPGLPGEPGGPGEPGPEQWEAAIAATASVQKTAADAAERVRQRAAAGDGWDSGGLPAVGDSPDVPTLGGLWADAAGGLDSIGVEDEEASEDKGVGARGDSEEAVVLGDDADALVDSEVSSG